MNRAHPLRIADANLLETRFHRQTLIEQQRSHRAVATDDVLLKFIEQVHVVNAGLRSRSAAVNSPGSGRQLPSQTNFSKSTDRTTHQRSAQGRIAKTRAGKP